MSAPPPPGDATISIERRMARSAAWMIALRLADRSVGLVSVLILARLLVPADFGLVAMGTVILGALDALTAFGFELALIQRQAKDRARWDSAWTLNAIIGAANAVAIIALAPLAAAFYDEPRVVHVMLMLALSAVISGFRNIGMVEFEQDLRFKPIVLLALARRMGSFGVTVVLAWLYGTYWALLIGIVVGQLVDLLLSYVISSYRPRFGLTAWRNLFAFSKWLLVNNLLGYATQRGGDVIVGGRVGAAALGIYTVSFELANLPTSEMVRPVMRAVFPGYAMMSSDRERLAQGFVKVFSLVLMFALPAAAGIALLADEIVAVLLGPRWLDAAPVLQVLAIYGGVRAAQANTSSIYLALDRPQFAAGMNFLAVLLAFGSFAIALGRMPMAEAAWTMVFGGLLAGALNMTLLTRLLPGTGRPVVGALARPAIGIITMAAVLVPLRDVMFQDGQSLAANALALVALVLIGALTFAATLLLAWQARGRPADAPESAVLTAVRGALRRRG